MEFKYKHVLGLEYFMVDGFSISVSKVKITGVSFVGETVFYLHGRNNTNKIQECDLFLTLNEAVEQCINNITENTDELKKELLALKEENFSN